VAGVVLLASNHPDDDVLERVLRFIPRSVARASMGLQSGSSRRNFEERFLTQTATEIAQATPFPDVPLTVVSSKITAGLTTSPAQAATYVTRQLQLAALFPAGSAHHHVQGFLHSTDQRSGARCDNHPRHRHRILNLNENPESAALRTRRDRRETQC